MNCASSEARKKHTRHNVLGRHPRRRQEVSRGLFRDLERGRAFEQRQPVVQGRIDPGRVQGHDPDARLGDFDRQRLGEADEPPFRGRVMGEARKAAQARDRRIRGA
jgi:hypothetical protein